MWFARMKWCEEGLPVLRIAGLRIMRYSSITTEGERREGATSRKRGSRSGGVRDGRDVHREGGNSLRRRVWRVIAARSICHLGLAEQQERVTARWLSRRTVSRKTCTGRERKCGIIQSHGRIRHETGPDRHGEEQRRREGRNPEGVGLQGRQPWSRSFPVLKTP